MGSCAPTAVFRKIRRSWLRLGAALILNFNLVSCSRLPDLEEATGGIPVSDIVLRIKCELSSALVDENDNWLPATNPKFAWLKNWTTQSDLTLEILDTATFSPGITLTQPLRNGYAIASGPSSMSTSGVLGTSLSAVTQSFAISGGGSLNGQAQRTQTLTIALSFAELERWRKSQNTNELCSVSDNMDLRGRLGLREWILEALSPVAREDDPYGPQLLFAGYHPKLQGAPAPTPKTSTPTAAPQAPGVKPSEAIMPYEAACNMTDAGQKLHQADEQTNIAATTLAQAESILKAAAVNSRANTITSSVSASYQQVVASQRAIAKSLVDDQDYLPVLEPAIRHQLRSVEHSNTSLLKYTERLKTVISDNLAYGASAKSAAESLKTASTTQVTTAKKAVDEAKTAFNAAKGLPGTDPHALSACRAVYEAVSDSVAATKTTSQFNSYAKKASEDVANAEKNMAIMTSIAIDANNNASIVAKPIDPPIATIGQSVQFIFGYAGNVTPTWTFVRFKGPNSPLFGASGTRTHMLNISLGPAVPGTVGTPSAGIVTNQTNLLLNNLLPSLQR